MTSDDGRQLFHEFVDCMDQPSNDGLNTYCVAKFARREGVKLYYRDWAAMNCSAGIRPLPLCQSCLTSVIVLE